MTYTNRDPENPCYTDDQLLAYICEEEGVAEDDHSDVSRILFDGRQPGACAFCGEVSSPHEPDARSNWCPSCERNGVRSFGVLLGLI